MSDTSNSNNDVNINVNMEGNAAQQAAELSAQIVNLSQHLATLSQRAVQNANVTKAFNQSMGLSASGVSQYSREITQSLNPLSRMTRAVEIQKRVLDQATKSAEAYSAAQRMLNQGSADPMALNRSNAAMSQSVKHMNAMRLSSNDLQKAMKQVTLLDYSRRMSENAMKSQQSAYNFFRNFSLPLITGLREAFFSYSKLATESNRTTKLILDNFNQIGAAGNFEDQVKAARSFTSELGKDLDKITRDWGTSRVLIQSLAGDFAELGISSRIVLGDLTRMTAETEKLGNLDISQSSEFIQTMYQTILRIRRETGKSVDINSDQVANEIISQLRGQLAVFNTIENKTVMSLRNIADAFPEVTAAATSFGLSMTEAMSLVIPMIGAGFQVGASANSVKVSLQRMVAMTKQNTQIINQLNAEMGTGFKYSAGVGMENIQMLTDAYRTLSKSVSEGGKGKQGALEFFSRLFGVRQGPRMETAFAQLAAFQTSLETYGSVERTTADILQNSINVELAAIGSKKIAIKQFLDLSDIHRMAIEKDSSDVLTAQAKAIQKGQKTAQKLLESANGKNSDFISGMSTEVGKALMAQAFDVQSLAGKQFEAELKLSQDTPEVRYRRAKESLMALGRAVVPVVDVFLKGLLPVLEKLASFLQNNPFVAKLVSALLGLVALSGPLRMFFTTMQTAFGGAVGLFVKLSRVISGTTLQFASLQDLIMNPNLLRGQQRVVQYLDGFLIKSKRGAKELKEAYDFSGISLPAKEAIQAGGIYGSDKAVNMKRMQPFVPQTDQFMNDLKAINAQAAAQSAAQVAAGAERGVTRGAESLSDKIASAAANAMHRFQGPNLFDGPNYFQNNIPFDGTPGSSRTPRTPRAPRGSGGAVTDDLTPEETVAAIAANEAKKARLRPPTVTTYPKGGLFPIPMVPTPNAKSFTELNDIIDSRVKRLKTSGLFGSSPSTKLAGILGKGPLALPAGKTPLSLGAGLPYITGKKIIEMFDKAGVELEGQIIHALSNMPYFNVSPKTLEGLGKVIKSKKGLFNLALTDSGVDERMKGRFISMVSNIKWGSKKKGFIASSIEKELMPIFDFINADIGKQVMLQIGGALNTIPAQAIEELKDIQSYLTPMGSKANVLRVMKKRVTIDKVKQYQPVLVSEFNKAMEELFISIEDSSGAVIQTAQGGVLNHIMATQSEFPDVASQGLTMHPKTGRIGTGSTSKYGDAAAKFLQDIQDGVVKVQTGVDSLGRETVQIIEIGSRNIAGVADAVESVSDDSPASIDFDKSVKEADKAAKDAVISARKKADQAAKDAAKAAKAGLPMPNYVMNQKVDKARSEIKKLKDLKAESVLRNATILQQGGLALPNTEGELQAVLKVMDEALVEHQQELLNAKKEFQNILGEANSIITEEINLQSTPSGKDRIQKAGLLKLKELKAEHAIDLKYMKRHEQWILSRRNLILESSPAAIQGKIDKLIKDLPTDVRNVVQKIESTIEDGINNAAVAAERRTAGLKRGLSRLRYRKGLESIETRTIKDTKFQRLYRSYRDIPMSAQAIGDKFMPDVFRSSGSRFFTDPRFSQPNAAMFNIPKRLSLKSVFKRPLGVGANLATTGKDIAIQFADNLEDSLNGILKTSSSEVGKITSAMRAIVSHNASGKGTSTVARETLAFLQKSIFLTEKEISTAMQAAVIDITSTFRAQTAGGLAGPGTKSQSPQSLAGFFERLRLGLAGKNAKGEKTKITGITKAFFGEGFKAKNLNLGLDSATGIENNLKVLFANVMKSAVKGLGSSKEALDEDVDTGRRKAEDILKPGRERQRSTKAGIPASRKRVGKAIKDAGREALDKVEEVFDEVNQPLLDYSTKISNEFNNLLNQQQAAVSAVTQSIPSGKEIGETLSAPIVQAQNAIEQAVVDVQKTGKIFPLADAKKTTKSNAWQEGARKQAEKELAIAMKEIDASKARAAEIVGVKPVSVNKVNARTRLQELSNLVKQEEKNLVEAVTAAQAAHPDMTPGKINNLSSVAASKKRLELFKKDIEDLEKYITQTLAIEQEKARVLMEKSKTPRVISPTKTKDADKPDDAVPKGEEKPSRRIVRKRRIGGTSVLPDPTTPSATGGAGKVIDIKKFGQVFKGPNLFHGPNIFDSSLSDLIPNFDELLSPVEEAAEAMADAGDEVATSLARVLAAGEAHKLTGNLVGPGEVGEVSRLSRTKARLFGMKGIGVPSVTAGLDAAQITKTSGLVDALAKKKLRLKFDDAGALIGMSRIKKLGGEMAISFDRANSILAGRLLPNFTRLNKFFSSSIVKGWAFALTGGLSAAVKPAQSLLKALTATGEASMRGKARAAIDTLVASRGPDQKTGIVRKAMAGLSGATGGINSLAAIGSKAADVMFKIASAIAMIGTVAVIALPIIVLMFGIFQAWKSAQGRLGATTEALKQSLTNLKDAVVALFAPIRDMVNGFLGASNIGGTFMTQGEKNAAMFLGIANAIKKATASIKKWAETTGKAFMTNQVAPFLTRLINRFILLGGAIKSAFSGDKEAAGKKLKAFLYSMIYELLNFTKGITDVIALILKGLIPVIVTIAQVGLVVFREMFKSLVGMAAEAGAGIAKNLSVSLVPGVGGAYFKYIGDPFASFVTGNGFKIKGEQSSEEFSNGFSTGLSGKLAKLIDPIKGGLDSALTKGMSEVAKKYAELMGQGINVPLAQTLKNPKAFKEALAYNAKQSADAATAAGESLGGNVNNGIKDKMKEIKETIKGYFYSNVDAKFEDIIQQYIDALSKQKDQQLKAYDDQIAGIDALADAEERLTAKKEYEAKRREMIDQRATDRENYLVERRLAVYEGRAFDVRKLDREEMLAQRNSGKEIQELDSGRLSQLQSEQRDLAKQAIANQKDLAEKQFQEVLDSFDRFIEDVKNKSFATQEEFAAALKKVGEQANISSADLAKVFANNIGELPGIIAGVRDPSIKMFSANMDDLIREASKKFGLDANVANPSTVLGAVRMMAIGSEEGFKAAFNPVFATTYVQPTVDAIAKITSSLSEKGNKNNIAEIWQKAGEDAFAKLKNELNRDIAFPKILASFSKLLEDIKPLVQQIVNEAAKASAAMEGIGGKPEIPDIPQSTLDEWTRSATLLMQSSVGGSPAQRAAMAASAVRIVSFIASNLLRGTEGIKAVLPSSGLTPNEQGWAVKIMSNINLAGSQVDLGAGGSGPLLPKKYYGGAIGHYGRGGFLEAPSSQGIPALLHGGEYIINHKAVEKFGKGNLARINALKNGGDLKGFASGGYMTTPGFANGGYMTTPGFGFGGFLDKLKFGLGGKGPGGPWGGLATGMRNAVVNAGSKAVRLVDSVLTGGALTDVSRSVVESAKGNNKEAAKLAATGVAKGTFQMLGGKLIGAAFKPLAKFGGAYFLEKAGLAGAGISASQAVRLGIGTATRNALEREAVAIAGSRVATGFGDNYLNTLVKEISGETTNYGTSQGLGDPATGLMGNVLRADNIAIRDAKAQANRLAFEAAQARGMTLNQAGGYPYPSGSFQSRGPITKIADLISNLNPFQQRIGIHVGRPGSTEILPNQMALSGTGDGIGGNVYSWLKGSVDEIVDLSTGFAKGQGFIDQDFTRFGAEILDETVKSGSYYITRAKGAILRDANIVNSPARMSPYAQVLQELPITSTKEELAAALSKYRGSSGVKTNPLETANNAVNLLKEQMANAPKQLTTGGSGGALEIIKKITPIKTYKAGTGVLGEMPKYNWDTGSLDLKQLGLYVHKIGKENVVFGGMKNPLKGLAKRNPSLNIKSVGLNPYEISNLKPGTVEGDAIANEWARAIIGYTDVMGNSKDDTFISALLYNWKRNKDLFAMLKFKQYESLGSIAVNEQKVKMSGNTGQIIDTLVKGKKDYFKLKDLFVTHETPYPVDIDELGNLTLKPMSAFDTTSMVSFKGPYPGGPYNLGKNAEYFRDTLHFALNHRVTGHGQRENVQEGNFIISQLLPMLKNNPGALDNLYSVDTFFTPPPGKGLNLPAGTFKVVPIKKGSGISPKDELEKYMIEVLGITEQADAGSTFGTISPEQIVQKYMISGGDHGSTDYADNAISFLFAKTLGVKTGRHFDQFNSSTMFGSLKKGANINPLAYLNSSYYPMAGENAWSRVMSRDPFAQNFEMPYDNPQLMKKIQKIYDAFKLNEMSFPGGLPYNKRAYNGGYMPKFKKGGYLKFKEGGEVPSILHGGEYVLNSAAVKKYGLAHLEAMNQMKFNVPSAGFSVPQAAYSGSAAGGMTTSTQNVNIYVDNFIGEPEWFNSMMKDYNTKILPKNQKAAGLENRVISTYNGLNRGQ